MASGLSYGEVKVTTPTDQTFTSGGNSVTFDSKGAVDTSVGGDQSVTPDQPNNQVKVFAPGTYLVQFRANITTVGLSQVNFNLYQDAIKQVTLGTNVDVQGGSNKDIFFSGIFFADRANCVTGLLTQNLTVKGVSNEPSGNDQIITINYAALTVIRID